MTRINRQGHGRYEAEVTVPLLTDAAVPLMFVCRICDVFSVVVEFDARSAEIPIIDQYPCPKGHITTLVDKLVAVEAVSGRTRVIAPRTRESAAISSLDMPTALNLLTAARAVLDQGEGFDRLSTAMEASPAPIRRLRPAKMERDQWIALAGVIVALIVGLLPIITDRGSADQTTIEIHLENPERPGDQDDQGNQTGDGGGPGKEEVELATTRSSEGDSQTPRGDGKGKP